MNIVQRGGGVTIFRSYERLHLTLSATDCLLLSARFTCYYFKNTIAMSTILDTLLGLKFILHAIWLISHYYNFP